MEKIPKHEWSISYNFDGKLPDILFTYLCPTFLVNGLIHGLVYEILGWLLWLDYKAQGEYLTISLIDGCKFGLEGSLKMVLSEKTKYVLY